MDVRRLFGVAVRVVAAACCVCISGCGERAPAGGDSAGTLTVGTPAATSPSDAPIAGAPAAAATSTPIPGLSEPDQSRAAERVAGVLREQTGLELRFARSLSPDQSTLVLAEVQLVTPGDAGYTVAHADSLAVSFASNVTAGELPAVRGVHVAGLVNTAAGAWIQQISRPAGPSTQPADAVALRQVRFSGAGPQAWTVELDIADADAAGQHATRATLKASGITAELAGQVNPTTTELLIQAGTLRADLTGTAGISAESWGLSGQLNAEVAGKLVLRDIVAGRFATSELGVTFNAAQSRLAVLGASVDIDKINVAARLTGGVLMVEVPQFALLGGRAELSAAWPLSGVEQPTQIGWNLASLKLDELRFENGYGTRGLVNSRGRLTWPASRLRPPSGSAELTIDRPSFSHPNIKVFADELRLAWEPGQARSTARERSNGAELLQGTIKAVAIDHRRVKAKIGTLSLAIQPPGDAASSTQVLLDLDKLVFSESFYIDFGINSRAALAGELTFGAAVTLDLDQLAGHTDSTASDLAGAALTRASEAQLVNATLEMPAGRLTIDTPTLQTRALSLSASASGPLDLPALVAGELGRSRVQGRVRSQDVALALWRYAIPTRQVAVDVGLSAGQVMLAPKVNVFDGEIALQATTDVTRPGNPTQLAWQIADLDVSQLPGRSELFGAAGGLLGRMTSTGQVDLLLDDLSGQIAGRADIRLAGIEFGGLAIGFAAKALTLDVNGRASARTLGAGDFSQADLTASVKADQLRIASRALPEYRLPVELADVKLALRSGTATLDVTDMKLAGGLVDVNLRTDLTRADLPSTAQWRIRSCSLSTLLRARPEPGQMAMLAGTLRSNADVDFSMVGDAMSPLRIREARIVLEQGRWQIEAQELGLIRGELIVSGNTRLRDLAELNLDQIRLSGSVLLHGLTYHDPTMQAAMKTVQLDVSRSDSELVMTPRVEPTSGRLSAELKINLAEARWPATLSWTVSDVSVTELFSLARRTEPVAASGEAPKQTRLEGELNTKGRLSISARQAIDHGKKRFSGQPGAPTSNRPMFADAQGSGNLLIAKGRIRTIPVIQAILGFMPGNDDAAANDELTADFRLTTQGVDFDGFTVNSGVLGASGLGLIDYDGNLELNVKPGKHGRGSIVSTVLTRVREFVVTGTLSEPKVGGKTLGR